MSIKAALAHGGALVAVLAVVAGSIVGETAKPFGRAEEVVAPGSPAVQICPDGWTQTEGRDPDGGQTLRVCTSPDKRYSITIREGQKPAGFDGEIGRFLSDSEIEALLR
jgi:hypothetical protein